MINRLDAAGTSGGWAFMMTSAGQLRSLYGTGSSFTQFDTYQSVPLNQWVHVAAVVSSVSGQTGVFYINGTLVPSRTSGNAATTLTQASVDLRIGAASATPAITYFNGYMAEARVWSAAQSQAQIEANMAINLTGSETNLVGLWRGNGNFNDLTSNANTLTASGGAIATQTANPYNATEYGVITKVTSSQITVFTGTSGTIPNMTLSGPQYSPDKVPFGFPAGSNKWSVSSIYATQTFQNSPVSGTAYNIASAQLGIPTGDWVVDFSFPVYGGRGSAGQISSQVAINTSVASPSDANMSAIGYCNAVTEFFASLGRQDIPITTTALTPYYAVFIAGNSSMSSIQLFAQTSVWGKITAVCAYV
jgi:hypothetical protein